MRIGVISDTHMPNRAKRLPQAVAGGLADVDLILHAGDWVSLEAVEMLRQIAPLDGVAGNNDGAEIERRFGRKKLLAVQGFRIGIVHGDGARLTTPERAKAAFAEERPDVIIFGHSHQPYHRVHDGILLFNPGSPTDKRFAPRYSFGILELGAEVTAYHLFFDDKS
jgi:hypothetical protein